MSIITDFTNRRMYFWRGYYFGKEGIWCRDFNKEEAFCVLKDPLYKDYMVRAIADNGKTIAVSRDINTNEPLLMVDVDKKTITNTIYNHTFIYPCLDREGSKVFSVTKSDIYKNIYGNPFCVDTETGKVIATLDEKTQWGNTAYHPESNSVYFSAFKQPNLYKFNFDTLTFSAVPTDKKIRIFDCKVACDNKGYYYLGSNILVYMNNEDEEVWCINFKEKEKLSGKTLFSICLSDHPDYIAVYLLDGNWLFIVNRNDFSYKKYKLGRVGFSEFFNNSLLLIDKNHNFSTLNLETLEEKPFLPTTGASL